MLRHEIWLFTKAQLTALVATAVDFLSALVLNVCFGMWYVGATFLGSVAGGVANCAINYRWVFHAQQVGKRRVALRYSLVWTGSIVLNTLGTYALTELSHVHFLLPKALTAILVGVFWNYQLQRFYVYRQHS